MIMAKYQTPGIYTEEISSLPPKIERTETIAVFIGYTQKHESENGENLLGIPARIDSFLQFERLFGFAQPEENIEITDDSNDKNLNISVRFNGDQSFHNLYYSVVSFFENGGNYCTIVSVGTYKNIGETLSATSLLTGLNSLKEEKSSLLIAIPEDQNLEEEDFYLLQKEILQFCKIHRGFSLLNLPKNTEENFQMVVENYRKKTDSDVQSLSFGAVFMPDLVTSLCYSYDEGSVKIKKQEGEFLLSSLKITDAVQYQEYLSFLQKFKVIIPPIGAVAGAMLYIENTRGIWKAPGNSALNAVLKPTFNINNREQDSLSVDSSGKSVNCIRTFTGKGTVIWGNRTLNGNSGEWRYIPIRRLVNQLEKNIQNALEIFIFEPNISTTWIKVKVMIENYLHQYWRDGAFFGAKPEQAYFVKCGHETMTNQDILDGRLIVQLGIAPLRPAEFMILQFQIKVLSS